MKSLFANRTSWIFDLDGTLTLPVHDFGFIRQELAIPEGEDILGHLETLPPDQAAQRHQRLDEIERSLAAHAEAAPGVVELLAYLAEQNIRMGILTRNSRDVALVTLEALGVRHHFSEEHILGRDDAPPKPDPGGILYLQKHWQVETENLVMVGDYIFDLQAGRSAGVLTVHVGRPDGQRWPEISDLMVESLADLLESISIDDTILGRRDV
jgi:HAD superfamily hydrolase (TIGR01549 family)